MKTIESCFDISHLAKDPEKLGQALAYLREFALHAHCDVENNNDELMRVINFKNISKSKYHAYVRTCELFGAEPLKPIGWSV